MAYVIAHGVSGATRRNETEEETEARESPGSGVEIPDLTFRRLMIGLTTEGWITADEGRDWLRRNAIPAVAQQLIADTYPRDGQARFNAEADMLAVQNIERGHYLVAALAQAARRSSSEVDDFFMTYARA